VIPGSETWGEDGDSMVFFGADGATQTIPTPKGDQRQYYINVRDALRGKSPILSTLLRHWRSWPCWKRR
jgi:hypothetical protein